LTKGSPKGINSEFLVKQDEKANLCNDCNDETRTKEQKEKMEL